MGLWVSHSDIGLCVLLQTHLKARPVAARHRCKNVQTKIKTIKMWQKLKTFVSVEQNMLDLHFVERHACVSK